VPTSRSIGPNGQFLLTSGYNKNTSNKRKRTESKIMGYLSIVLFFNAFELGTENANQVILSDEASSS
jgi:hypothetical protein